MISKNKLQELFVYGNFEEISNIFEKNEKRLDKILHQSDKQQASIIKLNSELEDYKNNLEMKVIEETSKRVEQEKLLMQSSKMAEMGTMLGAIIHQWKQPITIINMLTDIIKQDIKQNSLDMITLEKDIDTIKDRIILLSSTIDDFKNFFKPDKERKEFIVKDLVKNILRVIEHQILKYNATIQIDENSTIKMFGFENELKHVLLNIINNALEACNEKSETTNLKPNIKIDIKENTKESIIEISDNGGGIPEHIMEKLFTPYTTSKGENGTGIGLTLAKTIIQDHHKGELIAYNNKYGAVFIVTIPKEKETKC